jgi:propionyl-CoA:succinyl-CoA transferase
MAMGWTYATLAAEEAASLIPNGSMVAVGGLTPAGAPKAVPRALAARARELHHAGKGLQIKLLSGASTGAACNDELALAEAVSWRAPYMTSAPMRELANTGKLDFVDMHLSHVAQAVVEGFLGPIDFAVIEATEITPEGRVYLTTGIGNAPTFLQCADKVIIEHCAHPAYRDTLSRYLEAAPLGHIRHDLRRCFDLHRNYLEHGAMLPELDLSQFQPQRQGGPP